MNIDNTNKLFKKYPKIFKKVAYIGCGDGWLPLLEQLCFQIQSVIDHSRSQTARAKVFNRRLRKAIEQNSILPITRGDSFSHLINEATDALTHKRFKPVPEPVPQVVAHQIKEKFGTLRFYYSGGNDTIYGMIALAEGMSGLICESCGAPATIQSLGGFVASRCPKCVQEYYNRRV